MSYGVYTKDLKAVTADKLGTIEDARRWLRPGYVICTEKRICTGLSIRVDFNRFWEFKLKPSWGYLMLGFVEIAWCKKKMTWADKVVEEAKDEGTDEEATSEKKV